MSKRLVVVSKVKPLLAKPYEMNVCEVEELDLTGGMNLGLWRLLESGKVKIFIEIKK